MKKFVKKCLHWAGIALLVSLIAMPAVFAQDATTDCDADGDGYISFPETAIELVFDKGVDANGNYSAAEWKGFFNQLKAYDKASEVCTALNFKKGAEPARCDQVTIGKNDGVFDPAKVSAYSGSGVNPDKYDTPDDGIDQNCDGADGKFVASAAGGDKDLGELVAKTMNLISKLVVGISVLIMIYGGLLYATAAGDEQKTAKARKAIIGAIIGLVVGLLAPTIVNYITASLV